MNSWASKRFGAADVARLATVRPDGGPHIVPVSFALSGDVVWSPIDAKPKSGRRLQRLRNIEADPRVSLLVDHYEADWTALWWVRADGRATIVEPTAREAAAALDALSAKYRQYAAQLPPGPFIRIEVTRWASWHAR